MTARPAWPSRAIPRPASAPIYGEFLVNAQGEDVVAGIRTPQYLTKIGRESGESGSDKPSMEEVMPRPIAELDRVFELLEKHYRDMQDIEFTVQKRQALDAADPQRQAHRQGGAAHRRRYGRRGADHEEEAVLRVDPPRSISCCTRRSIPRRQRDVLATGLPASPGAASGEIVFTADEAERLGAGRGKVILVRIETSPEDIHGMHAAKGILTARGGMTSHAAVVARGMGKPCVSGAGELRIDMRAKPFVARSAPPSIKEGDIITIDGSHRRGDARRSADDRAGAPAISAR
jgi:pyruvate,orthophosphate dikinase